MSKKAMIINLLIWGVTAVLFTFKLFGADFSWWWVIGPLAILYGTAIVLGVFFALYDDYRAAKAYSRAPKSDSKKKGKK